MKIIHSKQSRSVYLQTGNIDNSPNRSFIYFFPNGQWEMLNDTELSDLHSSFGIINTTECRNGRTSCSSERKNMKFVDKIVSEPYKKVTSWKSKNDMG